MSFNQSPFHRNWRSQYHRMRRWHLMLEKLHSNETDAKLPIDYLDVVYAFFQSCYHLKDWVLTDKIKTSSEIKKFIDDNDCMKICADICNGTKHFNLKNSQSKSSIAIEPIFQSIEQNKIKKMKYIFCIDGIDYDPLSLASVYNEMG